MAKKKRVRYTKEEAFRIEARVNAAKKVNKTWPQIHAIAKEAGYKGGVDSLKQRYGSKSHRVGNAKTGNKIVVTPPARLADKIAALIEEEVARQVAEYKKKVQESLK